MFTVVSKIGRVHESKVCFQVSKTKNSISGIFVKCLEIVP